VEEALDPPAGPEDEANAIGFDTFLDRVPQNGIKPLATTVGIDELKGQGFMVQAYQHGMNYWNVWTDDARTATPNFMRDQTVTWSGSIPTPGTWTYSPIRYWPRTSANWYRVSFFAYSPSTVTFVHAGAEDENKNPKLHYIMPTSYSTQTDLIVDVMYNTRGDENGGKVKFNFDHVLSRIGFQAQIPESYYGATSITITSLSFNSNKLYVSGTYTFNSSTVSYSSSKNNKALSNWDVTGASTATTSTYLFYNLATPIMLTDKPLNLAEYDTPHRYLMLIPQENAFEQAYVQVSYTIHYPPGSDPSIQSNTTRAYLPPIPSWEPGKAYTYTLNIAPRAVIVDVNKVEDWSNWKDNPIPIDVP
jgi:hypothetical protein